ncbi:MAG: ABC transporter ATP-binding protein [Oscillospiraceae bacterium]|jgi:iron complex transport system ATP-binding protein|nr:ABC transporter ATP-binding protein [Oscillospiraceae bacterium]
MKIEVEGLEFSYKEHAVLRGLDFSAEGGDVVAVLGPNGVGKSTLFRCLLGFLHPQKGGIRIDGRDIRTMSSAETARCIAYIPQSVSPAFNYTVQDTVLMGLTNQLGTFQSPRSGDVRKVVEVLDSLGIAHLRHRGCGQISGGERQLTLLARALIQNAGILVMDEPTANLDYGNSWRVMERIADLARGGYTVIFSTHDPNHAFMHANRVLVLKDGGALAVGAPREVLTEGVLSRLYNINVLIRRVPYNGGEATISLPAGAANSD